MNVGSIKRRLKKTYLYQHVKSLRDYETVYSRQHGTSRFSVNALKKIHVIYQKENTVKEKLNQIKKAQNKINIDITVKEGFVYFIDENVILYSANRVIDNLPPDYSVFLDHSLQALMQDENKNDVTTANRYLLEIIEEYINAICKCVNECDYLDEAIKERIIQRFNAIKYQRAESLEEALQRVLFLNQLFWQTGHKLVGLGRLDKLLNRFPVENDSEILIENFVKVLHYYYNYKSSAMLGDTGQVIILGGKEEDGSYFSNEYTELFLKAITKVRLPDPKILLRLSTNTPDRILQLAVDCLATGCGSPLLSNDERVIPAISAFGYNRSDAYNYVVSACWEPLPFGRALEQNNLFNIEFGKVFVETLTDAQFENCTSMEEILQNYSHFLKKHLSELTCRMDSLSWEVDPLLTLTTPCCWESGKDISLGGAVNNNYGLLSVGLASAVDSLLNIKKFVFEQKKYSLSEVKNNLQSNYSLNKEMRGIFDKREDGFGTDADEVIALTNYIINIVKVELNAYRNCFGGKVKFGLSSPSYVHCGQSVAATADGRLATEPFATHISRSKGDGITEIINFAGRLDYLGASSNGNVVDIFVPPLFVNQYKEQFILFLKNAIKVGFFQMQFNILTYQQLLDAKAHPDQYPDLIVRVWGFSAYFKDIPEEFQNVLIERARACEQR